MSAGLNLRSQLGLGLTESLLGVAILAVVSLASSTLFLENSRQSKNAVMATNVIEIKQAMESFIWSVAKTHSEFNCRMSAGDLDRHVSGSKLTPSITVRFASDIPTAEFSPGTLRHAGNCSSPIIPDDTGNSMRLCFILERTDSTGNASSISNKSFLLVIVESEFINLTNDTQLGCKGLHGPSFGGGMLSKYSIHWSEKGKDGLIDKSYVGGFYATN